jgi:hypothetical protein
MASRLRREVRLLLESSVASLTLGIELFNRPSDLGRTAAVLMHVDHAIELLLKAAIVHRGGKIREPRTAWTISFDKCVGKCLDDAKVKFLTRDEALPLQAINALRDEAQHYHLMLSEQPFYAVVRSGVTLYGDLLKRVFGIALATRLPGRVLPITADPPKDLHLMIEDEIRLLRDLIKPGRRRKAEAKLRLRSLAVIEGAVIGDTRRPSDGELSKQLARISAGDGLAKVFPGVAGLSFTTAGDGPTLTLRITQKQGTAVHLVGEGDETAAVIGVKSVDSTGYYSMGFTDLFNKLSDDIGRNKLSALLWHMKISEDARYSRVFRFGKSAHPRYAPEVISRLREALKTTDMDAVWAAFRKRKAKLSN